MEFDEACKAIRTMEVRGAAAIGRLAARTLAQAATDYDGPPDGLDDHLRERADALLATRPTAVSLGNAVHAVLGAVAEAGGDAGVDAKVQAARRAAEGFVERSHQALDTIARYGAARIADGDTVLTHCNSQAALGCIVRAHEQGKEIRVYATESRPFRQGEITVGQLSKAGVPATLIVDSAVAHVMPEIDAVFAGADTITAQGTVVNKIGTHMVALLAYHAQVPFHTCAETYKFSPATLKGEPVPIEERDPAEVIDPATLPAGVTVENPVFDFTPARYVDAIICEVGVISPHDAARIIRDHLDGSGPA